MSVESADQRTKVLDWLLSYAIGMEYSDRADELQKIEVKSVEPCIGAGTRSVDLVNEDLIEVDIDSPEFKQNLNILAEALDIPKDDSVEAMLRACATILEQKFSAKAMSSEVSHKVIHFFRV